MRKIFLYFNLNCHGMEPMVSECFFLFWYHRFNFGSGTSVIEICVFYVIGVRIRNPWRQVRLWHIGVRWDTDIRWILQVLTALNSKVHEANIGPTCGRQDQGGRHVGHVNLAIWESFFVSLRLSVNSSVREFLFIPFCLFRSFPLPPCLPSLFPCFYSLHTK